MLVSTNKERGVACLSMAIAYFGSNGYNVSVPLNDTQCYDLVVEVDGIFKSVQCKYAGGKTKSPNSFKCGLRSCGGTKGVVYHRVVESHVDLLFCITPKNTMYLIPLKDIFHTNEITLVTEQSRNSKNDTYKYIVTL